MATQVTLLYSTPLFGWQLAIVYFDRNFLPRSSNFSTAPRIRDTFASRCRPKGLGLLNYVIN